jgi:tRNA uridine 5-carboxymethylaminomethyl modification enzyme
LGLIGTERYQRVEQKRAQVAAELQRLENTWLPPSQQVNAVMARFGFQLLNKDINALQLLRRPEVSYELIAALFPDHVSLLPDAIEGLVVEAKYSGYIAKEQEEIERMRRLEEWRISPQVDYAQMGGLRREAGEKLARFRPATVGQAARIEGVNPADISILLIHLRRGAAS